MEHRWLPMQMLPSWVSFWYMNAISMKFLIYHYTHSSQVISIKVPYLLESMPQLKLFSDQEGCSVYSRAANIRGIRMCTLCNIIVLWRTWRAKWTKCSVWQHCAWAPHLQDSVNATLRETLTAIPQPKNGHDRQAWRTSATTHWWVYRNSPLPCSGANSRALRWTAVQVTLKFSELFSSIFNGSSILWCLVVLLCNLPHSATSLPGACPSLFLVFSTCKFSSWIPCIRADALLLYCKA